MRKFALLIVILLSFSPSVIYTSAQEECEVDLSTPVEFYIYSSDHIIVETIRGLAGDFIPHKSDCSLRYAIRDNYGGSTTLFLVKISDDSVITAVMGAAGDQVLLGWINGFVITRDLKDGSDNPLQTLWVYPTNRSGHEEIIRGTTTPEIKMSFSNCMVVDDGYSQIGFCGTMKAEGEYETGSGTRYRPQEDNGS